MIEKKEIEIIIYDLLKSCRGKASRGEVEKWNIFLKQASNKLYGTNFKVDEITQTFGSNNSFLGTARNIH